MPELVGRDRSIRLDIQRLNGKSLVLINQLIHSPFNAAPKPITAKQQSEQDPAGQSQNPNPRRAYLARAQLDIEDMLAAQTPVPNFAVEQHWGGSDWLFLISD